MSDAEGRTLAEIVDAIVDELDLPEAQLDAARVEVRRLVDASFQHMGRGLIPRAGKRVLAERAERIAELADALELELLNLPPPLHYLITPPSARFGAPPASDQLDATRKEHLEALLHPLRSHTLGLRGGLSPASKRSKYGPGLRSTTCNDIAPKSHTA